MTTNPHMPPTETEVNRLARAIAEAEKIADAYNGPGDVAWFKGDGHFDMVGGVYVTDANCPETGSFIHDFANCPYHRLKRLKQAYRRLVDPRNMGEHEFYKRKAVTDGLVETGRQSRGSDPLPIVSRSAP